jgi:predicted PurR-regulated permease PerM
MTMKHSIFSVLMIATLLASSIVPAIAQAAPSQSQQQPNLDTLNESATQLQNHNKLNPRFKAARQQNLNKLNPRFKAARLRTLNTR